MKQLFVTTALAAALSVTAAQAQETESQPVPMGQETAPAADEPLPTITPPDGYVEGEVVLTTENLQGATVYDASGDEIGEVHGLVFANGSTSLQGGDAGAAMQGSDAATTMPAPGADTEVPDAATETTPAAAETGTDTGDTTGMAATDTATAPGTEDANTSVESGTASPEATAPALDTDSSNVASGTDRGDSDRIEGIGSDAGTITPTDATTPPVQTAPEGEAQPMGSAEISHAIIDVGGFLGMGEHRVAIPVGDLVVYRKDTDIRIYLPWTRQQLEALPEFDEDGPAPVTQ
ncbi:photosystem reaction center protein H [Paracoccus versutus]